MAKRTYTESKTTRAFFVALGESREYTGAYLALVAPAVPGVVTPDVDITEYRGNWKFSLPETVGIADWRGAGGIQSCRDVVTVVPTSLFPSLTGWGQCESCRSSKGGFSEEEYALLVKIIDEAKARLAAGHEAAKKAADWAAFCNANNADEDHDTLAGGLHGSQWD